LGSRGIRLARRPSARSATQPPTHSLDFQPTPHSPTPLFLHSMSTDVAAEGVAAAGAAQPTPPPMPVRLTAASHTAHAEPLPSSGCIPFESHCSSPAHHYRLCRLVLNLFGLSRSWTWPTRPRTTRWMRRSAAGAPQPASAAGHAPAKGKPDSQPVSKRACDPHLDSLRQVA